MSARPSRPAVLGVALALALLASGWTYWRGAAWPTLVTAVATTAPGAPAVARARAPASTPAPVPAQWDEAAALVDIFAPVNWEPPAVSALAPAVAVAPAAPQAPAMPFEYLGRTEVMGQSGVVRVHLRRGNDVFSVAEGGNIDEHYQLYAIGPDALQIDYLPMAARQTLVIGIK